MRASLRVEMTAGKTCSSAHFCAGHRRWSKNAAIGLVEPCQCFGLIDPSSFKAVPHVCLLCTDRFLVFSFIWWSAYIPRARVFSFFFSLLFYSFAGYIQIPQEEISLLFFSVLSGRNDASFFPFFSHLRFPLLFIHTCSLSLPTLSSVICRLSLFLFLLYISL